MMAAQALFPVMVLVIVACGCASNDDSGAALHASGQSRPASRPATQSASYTGVLRGGMMAIGGETTGWVLARDGGAGQVDLDVSAVRGQAKRLDGQRVTVIGRLTQRDYTERGTVPVLTVQKITPAAPPL